MAKFPQGNHLSQNSSVPHNLSKTQKVNIYIDIDIDRYRYTYFFTYSPALNKALAGFEMHILVP